MAARPMVSKVDRMIPIEQSPRPRGQPAAKPKPDAMAAARESLAPSPTHFAHRPDWQAALDDEAAAQSDRSGA